MVERKQKENLMKWRDRFLKLAREVATWSRDPSTQVGAVLVDGDNRVVGMGFNGFPRGVSDDEGLYANRDVKYPRTIHAEVNAVLNANGPVEGCEVYVTAPPCMNCAAVLIQSGVRRIVWMKPSADLSSRWGEQFDTMRAFLDEAGVEYEEVG